MAVEPWKDPGEVNCLTFPESYPRCDCPTCEGVRDRVAAGFAETKRYVTEAAQKAAMRARAARFGDSIALPDDDDEYDGPPGHVPRRCGFGPSFVMSGSPAADKLSTHAAVVRNLRELTRYDYPNAAQQAHTSAMMLDLQSQQRQSTPPRLVGLLPRAPLVHFAPRGYSRRRPVAQGSDGPRHDHFSSLERNACGVCSSLGCSCAGFWEKHAPGAPKDQFQPPVCPLSPGAPRGAKAKSSSAQKGRSISSKSLPSLGSTTAHPSTPWKGASFTIPRLGRGKLASLRPPPLSPEAEESRKGMIWSGW